MMNPDDYKLWSVNSIAGKDLAREAGRVILESPQVELLPLLQAAFHVRKEFTGTSVKIHVINNAQNGHCPEDCHYCAQAKSSDADIVEYPLKSDEEFLAEAQAAYQNGAFRYCMVFAGRGPSARRVDHLASLIRSIKSRYPIEVCVSAGILDAGKAAVLKEAGLDRLNHNLNTSHRHYEKICTTHTYADRLQTLKSAKSAGLEICSGVIVGLGEGTEDILEMAYTLRSLQAASIPVNFFMPIPGVRLKDSGVLTPDYCLRVLCLFRFINPKAEIRIAAGREIHLRSMEVMALYPANSLFLDGYLNTKGEERRRTFQMIKDAGFTIESEYSLDELIGPDDGDGCGRSVHHVTDMTIKGWRDLRPQRQA